VLIVLLLKPGVRPLERADRTYGSRRSQDRHGEIPLPDVLVISDNSSPIFPSDPQGADSGEPIERMWKKEYDRSRCSGRFAMVIGGRVGGKTDVDRKRGAHPESENISLIEIPDDHLIDHILRRMPQRPHVLASPPRGSTTVAVRDTEIPRDGAPVVLRKLSPAEQ
jgi:hypothetical protein